MIVTTEAQLAEVVEAYSRASAFALDVEARGDFPLDPKRSDVFWISLATTGRADAIPMGHPHGRLIQPEQTIHAPIPGALTPTGKPSQRKVKQVIPAVYSPAPEQLTQEQVFSALKPVLLGDALKVGHNLKYDLPSIGKYLGENPAPPYADTKIMAFLCDERVRSKHTLAALVKHHFDFEYDQLGKRGVQNFPFDQAATYSSLDSKYAWLLYKRLLSQLTKEDLLPAFDLEMKVLEVVISMEQEGATIDIEAMEALHQRLATRLAEIQAQLDEYNGGPINLNADRQVARLVFDVRGHTPKVFTEKTQEPSVSAKALEPYKKDPVVGLITEHAELHKVFSTYIDNNLPLVKAAGGKLYAEFDQTGARTGRFSSKAASSGLGGMNLQNVPTRKGKEVRELFIAPPGYSLVIADYSQIELRVLAHFTQDPMLLKAYRDGLDLHTMTAKAAYKTDAPTDRQRSLAKNVNFTIAFMGGPNTIVSRYEVKKKEAEQVFEAFWQTYKQVKPWTRSVIAKCRKEYRAKGLGQPAVEPFVRTIVGRKRRLSEILWNPQDPERAKAERQAVNTIIQGSAADIAKMAMVEMHKEFAGTKTRLIMVVHDEFVVVTPDEDADSTVDLVRDCMERVNPFTVPLVADVNRAKRWSDK